MKRPPNAIAKSYISSKKGAGFERTETRANRIWCVFAIAMYKTAVHFLFSAIHSVQGVCFILRYPSHGLSLTSPIFSSRTHFPNRTPFSRVCSTFFCVSFATSMPFGHSVVSLPRFFTNLKRATCRGGTKRVGKPVLFSSDVVGAGRAVIARRDSWSRIGFTRRSYDRDDLDESELAGTIATKEFFSAMQRALTLPPEH